MMDENQELKSEAQKIAETAVRIDRILNQAKELALKLRKTSDALNRIVDAESNDNVPSE